MNLTAAERILLHISDYWRAAEPLDELTQKGIAAGAGVLRSHVPRSLKRLIAGGYVDEAAGRVGARGRKVRFYRITEAGFRRAKELKEALSAERATHAWKETTVGELSKRFAMSPLAVIQGIDSHGQFHPPPLEAPHPPGLIERDEDLAHLRKWHREGGPVMVVYGAAGIGKTALGRAFISQSRGRWAWVDLQEDEGIDRMLSTLSQALEVSAPKGELRQAVMGYIKSQGVLVVLDGYQSVSEEVVDFLSRAVQELQDTEGRLLVLAQETTPSYCRFYDRDSVGDGIVWERHLRGLSMQGCRKMLGVERIDSEALKRIYLLTKGTPLYLDLIRRGAVDELRKRSRFTSAEIRLLMFSKEVPARD